MFILPCYLSTYLIPRLLNSSMRLSLIGFSFRGPAPLHHILLSCEKNIGISLQTLHPNKFDHGEILAQTEYPGFEHKCSTVPQLVALVAPRGAEMLVKGLKDRVYIPPIQHVGSPHVEEGGRPLREAPKIISKDRHIDWDTWTADRIIRTHHVLGPLWNTTQSLVGDQLVERRIIWAAGFQKLQDPTRIFPDPGHPMVTGIISKSQSLCIRTCDNHILLVDQVKIEGEGISHVWHAIQRHGMVALPNDTSDAEHDFAIFRAKLM